MAKKVIAKRKAAADADAPHVELGDVVAAAKGKVAKKEKKETKRQRRQNDAIEAGLQAAEDVLADMRSMSKHNARLAVSAAVLAAVKTALPDKK